jgi:hypothetical protein
MSQPTAKSLFALLASKAPTSTVLSQPFLQSQSLSSSFVATYQTMLGDVFERKRLQELDQGGEKKLDAKELTRRSAARSGFSMPDEYKP